MTPLAIAIFFLQIQAASVEGLVTKPGSGEPLAGARVTLLPATAGKALPPISVTSQDDGSFTIQNVATGDYLLWAESVRYGIALYGQRRAGGPGTRVSVASGQRVTGIRISMIPTGAIAGRITLRNGEPAVQAIVHALELRYQDGKRILTPVKTTTTDDLGEYRLFGLSAGKYFVTATANESPTAVYDGVMAHRDGAFQMDRPADLANDFFVHYVATNRSMRTVLEDGTVQEEAWVMVYYPGTIDAALATAVEVLAGATMNGIHLSIAPSPARRVSGKVVAPPGSLPAVTLTRESTVIGTRGGVSSSGSDFPFEFNGVSPGVYILTARDPRTETVSAPLRIEVGNRNVENLTLTLVSGVSVEGRIVVENTAEPVAGTNPLDGLAVSLHQGSAEGHVGVFQPQPTASFVARNLSPGTYFVRLIYDTALNGLPAGSQSPNAVDWTRSAIPGFFVKSVRLGQVDVTDGIPITESTQDRLQIVLSSAWGSLEGNVTDPRRMPAPGATVVLVPSKAGRDSSLYRATVADATGRYRLQGVVPGDYLLFAWEDVETGAWQDPDFLRPAEPRGRSVQIRAGENPADPITVIAKP